MKKLYLPGAAALILFSFILFAPKTKPSKTLVGTRVENNNLDGGNEAEEDGPEKVLHHEFIMTHDPLTGTVPSERLAEANLSSELSRNQNTTGSKIQWTERGPNNIGGRTRAILIDASDATGNTVWAGSAGGGLWKTTTFKSASPNWTLVPGISQNLAITTIAQHPSSPAIIYVGTGEGFSNVDAIRGLGVYYTANSGTSWTLLPSTTTGGANAYDFMYVQKLLVTSNGSVYAAASSIYCNQGGVLKSTDNGSSWTRVVGVSTGSCVTSTDMIGMDLEISTSGDLWASTKDVTTNTGRVWKSPAGASVGNAGTWTNVTPAGTFQRIDIECSKTTNGKVYALTQGSGSATGGVRLTTDGGTTWSAIDITTWCDQGTTKPDFTRGQAWYDLILATDPNNDATILAGGVDIMKSTNSGTAWAQATQWASGCTSLPNVHADIHAIKYFPGSSTQLIVGCDGGIFYSSDGGATFTSKNTNYNATQYYSVAMHPTAGSNYMLAGAQDNGSHRFSTTGVNSVTTASGGDGGMCYIDTDNPNYQFTAFTGCIVNFSSNGGTNFATKANLACDRFINPGDYDASTDMLYCGGPMRQLYRIGGFATTVVNTAFTVAASTNNSVSAVKVDPNTANRLWVAFSTGDGTGTYAVPELYIIDNANAAPTTTAVTLPAGIAASGNYISSLDVEQGNAAHVLLTVSNYGVTSVWESTNSGTSWTSIEGNLPDMPVRWGKFIPSGYNPGNRTEAVGGILLGTELGVWSTSVVNGASTVWMSNNFGMGNVRVDMIQIRASDKTIGVATHGRGLFTGIFNATLPVASLEFTGALNNSTVELNWTTSSEQNTKSYEIEKSTDGINFSKIGAVNAAGNSTSGKSYSFTDQQLSATNYYRLRINDLDGKNTLSSVVSFKYGDTKQNVWVVNNPFKEFITVSFAAQAKEVTMQLIGTNGATVAEKMLKNVSGQFRWDLPGNISRGTYLLKTVADDKSFTNKLVKQ